MGEKTHGENSKEKRLQKSPGAEEIITIAC